MLKLFRFKDKNTFFEINLLSMQKKIDQTFMQNMVLAENLLWF